MKKVIIGKRMKHIGVYEGWKKWLFRLIVLLFPIHLIVFTICTLFNFEEDIFTLGEFWECVKYPSKYIEKKF